MLTVSVCLITRYLFMLSVGKAIWGRMVVWPVSFRSPSLFYLLVHSRCRGFFIFTWSHSNTHHSRQDSSGRRIGPSHRPLPDDTNTHKRQTSMPPMGFEPTIPASARPQTYAFDRAATGIGSMTGRSWIGKDDWGWCILILRTAPTFSWTDEAL
jgi:hypothetical protein